MNTTTSIAVGFAAGSLILPLVFVLALRVIFRDGKKTKEAHEDRSLKLLSERNDIDRAILSQQMRIANYNATMIEIHANKPDGKTPNPHLQPLNEGPRRKMLIEIEVGADFEKNLNNQWEVEREIHADRWTWNWADQFLGEKVHALELENSGLAAEIEKLKAEKKTS